MKKGLKESWSRVAVIAGFFSIALLINVGLTIHNNNVISETHLVVEESASVMQLTDKILTNTVHGLDLGVRGFALTKDEKMLNPYSKSVSLNEAIFRDLEKLLIKQRYPQYDVLKKLRTEIENYKILSDTMLALVRLDSMATFNELLVKDKGLEVWTSYSNFYEPLLKFEKALTDEAYDNSERAERNNLILQLLIIVITIPVLIVIVLKLRKESKDRQRLLSEVRENDKNYVFDPGDTEILADEKVIETSIRNTKKASEFIKTLASGNYDVEWKGLTDQNIGLNQSTLAGDLINMREKLRTVKVEDEKRNWMNEGLAKFSEIVRNHQHEPKVLADKCVSFLTKYLNSQQGTLFVLEGEEGGEYLNLASSYAFDKKKWVEKRIEIGNGLIGQAFLEGDITQLKDVPNGYTQITSGLGDATPKYIVIVPLKYDVHTVAVVELASFTDFEEHHTMFLKKGGEFLASAILNSQTTQKMKTLLDNARMNEEQMRAQEEEMRQNMEELQATQEELVRKEKERMKRSVEAPSES